jgi:hypothetical protein
MHAGLVLTELNIEAKEKRNPVYIALTDAKKAFDKVWHEDLYREMHKMNIYGDNWLLASIFNSVKTSPAIDGDSPFVNPFCK